MSSTVRDTCHGHDWAFAQLHICNLLVTYQLHAGYWNFELYPPSNVTVVWTNRQRSMLRGEQRQDIASTNRANRPIHISASCQFSPRPPVASSLGEGGQWRLVGVLYRLPLLIQLGLVT